MSRNKHYSPAIDRFVVKALYHEARGRGVAMTTLTNQLLEEALRGGEGWRQAQNETMMLQERPPTEPVR